jgi:hypothetical protein
MFKKLVLTTALLLAGARSSYALQADELLSLVAMPLAVASVSELTGVPADALTSIVQLLNEGAVPPAEVIEVVRYVPVALVEVDPNRDFVRYVTVQRQQGLTGLPLVDAIERELQTYGIPGTELQVTAPRVVIDQSNDIVPPLVRTRITERSSHPHGGPPGQLKKELGLKTGAEVVHGKKPGHDHGDDVKPAKPVTVKPANVKVEKPAKSVGGRPVEDHGKSVGKGHDKGNHGGGKGPGGGKGHGNGKGKGR